MMSLVTRGSSKKPSKQRKRHFEAPLHQRGKVMSVHLSDELREKYGVRSIPLRVGDTVSVMRGDVEGLEGKVSRVDRKRYKVYVEGITRKKQSGETVVIPIHHTNLRMVKLDMGDPWRKEKLEALEKAAEG